MDSDRRIRTTDPEARRPRRALAASTAVAVLAALAVGISGTAKSESAPWPDGRVAVLWPTFAALPRAAGSEIRARVFNGSFRGCVQSAGLQLDYRCEYGDRAGHSG